MSVRRSKRSAAAAAETRISRVVEDDSEDSNASSFDANRNNSSTSDAEDTISSGNASDGDFEEQRPLSTHQRHYGKGKKMGPRATAAAVPAAVVPSAPATTCFEPREKTASAAPPETNSSAFKELGDISLKALMRSFRLTDLQALMIFVGKNKAGRKTELMERACELVDTTSGDIKKRLSEKIQELSNDMYRSISSAPSVNPYSSNYRATPNAGAYNPNAATAPSASSATPASYLPLPPHLSSNGNGMSSGSSVPRYEPSPYQAPNHPYYRDPHLMYPTCPDVQLRALPFYKIEAVLMKPSSLQPRGLARFQEQTFSFHLTPTQANAIDQSSYRDATGRPEFKRQVQLRFSLLETSCEQDDNFPASVCVKVNGRLQTLPNPIPTNKPGVEPKRPPKPINITGLCKLSSTVPNYVNVTWAVEVGSGYTVSIYLVDKLSSTDLMNELKKKGKRHSDYTRAVIKDKLSDKDNEIATTSCKVTLACPLGKMRMTTPCRSSTCDHLQCFDASLYLMMNEKKPKWVCPVCNKSALYENLLIDGYFTDVLTSQLLSLDEHEIVLKSDASWEPLVPAKKSEEGEKKPRVEAAANLPGATSPAHEKVKNVETLSLDDDDDDDNNRPLPPVAPSSVAPKPSTSKEVSYVTLDSDDEDDVIAPPAPKRPRTNVIDDDDNSDSVSAITPRSMTPPSASNFLTPPPMANGNESPEIICLDDD